MQKKNQKKSQIIRGGKNAAAYKCKKKKRKRKNKPSKAQKNSSWAALRKQTKKKLETGNGEGDRGQKRKKAERLGVEKGGTLWGACVCGSTYGAVSRVK